MLTNELGLELLKQSAHQMLDDDLETEDLSPADYEDYAGRVTGFKTAMEVVDFVMEYAGMDYEDMVQWVYGSLVLPKEEEGS